MKKVLLILLVAGAAAAWYYQRKQAALNPEVIAHPTYAEIHMTLEARNRTFEQVLFAQTVDAADCERYTKSTLAETERATQGTAKWALKSADCKAELSPRYASLFDNQPTFVTYLSIARGERKEREARLIYWGVSVAESDRVCDGVAAMQRTYKGAVTCVRAIR